MPDRDELRSLIQDQPRLETARHVGYGDGALSIFLMPRRPLLADGLQIFIDGAELDAGDYTINLETGGLTFDTPPSEGDAITATYHYVTLSDAELDSVLSRNPGSIYLAAAEAIQLILAGKGRLVNFAKADARFDASTVRNNLMQLAEHYRRMGASSTSPKVESFDYPRTADIGGDD
jgi:hypothetical protein